MKKIITLLMMLSVFAASAQKGVIKGIVTDESGEAVPFANVIALKDGKQVLGTTTDFDGRYILMLLDSGEYVVQVSFVGYKTEKIKGVVTTNNTTALDVQIQQGVSLECVEISYSKPIRRRWRNSSATLSTTYNGGDTRGYATTGMRVVKHRKEIEQLAVRSVSDIVKTAGDNMSGSPITFLDGVRVISGSYIAAKKSTPRRRKQKLDYNYEYPEVKKDAYTYLDEDYQDIADNEFESPKKAPLSTFSVDVDRASYANMRRYINDGYFPPQSAIRVEELINYFNYDYPQPEGDHPLSITTELAECPWNKERKLALIGIQGKEINMDDAPASNLVFLLDVSGSMNSADKLGLLKKGLKLLVEQMREEDKIAIVVYAGAAGVVLNSTHGDEKNKIKSALNKLSAGGSTAGGAGIQLAYKIAKKNFIEGGNNRIILASDGDFNVGPSSQDELVKLIEKERKGGVFLSVLGFGTGNLRDQMMEQVADHGNGNYNYIDNILEAKKVLVSEMGGTLFTIAKDVKVQAEFNPKLVKSYRLVGYVNRLLADEDFNNDKKDAGEMGSGHTVTVMYELIMADSKENVASIDALKYQVEEQEQVEEKTAFEDEVLTVKFRYKKPEEDHSTLISAVLKNETKRFVEASENFRFSASVASFGMKLRSSESAENISYEEVMEMAKAAKGEDEEGYRAEFIKLVKTAGLME